MTTEARTQICPGTNKDGSPCRAHERQILESGYCHAHDPERREERFTDWDTPAHMRKCQHCGRKLPAGTRSNAKFCPPSTGRACRASAYQKRARAKKRQEAEEQHNVEQIFPSETRRGPDYAAFAATEWPQRIKNGYATQKAAAEELGLSPAAVSRYMNTFHQDMEHGRVDDWRMADEDWALLGPLFEPINRQTKWKPGPALDHLVDELADAFFAWLDRFARTEHGQKWIIKPFHVRWVKLLLKTWLTGSRQMILSPPRHMKSELLKFFCMWMICRNPNIRIVWIGPNGDIAKDSLRSIMDHLEENQGLIDAYTPPGQLFRPAGKGRSNTKMWSPSGGQFVVGTRTAVGMKSATMVAFGRGGKVLSRDADLIICDDLEDHDSTKFDETRADTRRWFGTTFGSRKMFLTAVFVIGSRQHWDDLYSRLLENSRWECTVESAHDWACEKDAENEAIHTDCMLFPEINPYAWLMDQMDEMEENEPGRGRLLAQMVYLNRLTVEGQELFDKGQMEACRRRDLVMKDTKTLPPHTQLIGSIDPTGSSGKQAVMVWAYWFDEKGILNERLIDAENSQLGGFDGARDALKRFSVRYPNLKVWFVESNLYDGELMRDAEWLKIKASYGLTVLPHQTGKNKRDPKLGPTAMAPMFREELIELPYGDSYSQGAVDEFIRQCLRFNTVMQLGRSAARKLTIDMVMAGWFPQEYMRHGRDRENFQVSVVDETGFDYENVDWDTLGAM